MVEEEPSPLIDILEELISLPHESRFLSPWLIYLKKKSIKWLKKIKWTFLQGPQSLCWQRKRGSEIFEKWSWSSPKNRQNKKQHAVLPVASAQNAISVFRCVRE